MGIKDFFKKGEKEKMDTRRGREAENPRNRQRDKEQITSDRPTAPGEDKSFKPRHKPSAPSHKYYEVQVGDTLSRIAKERYGDADKWKLIYEMNKDKIKDPDHLEPGQQIEIPDTPPEKTS